jgi:predicted RNase H-like nuclease (RuvC/YqgF family)
MKNTVQEQASTAQEVVKDTPSKKAWIIKTAIVWATLLATQVQANSIIDQCDFSWDWKISTRRTYKADWVSRDIAKKELKCKLKLENTILDEEIRQWKEEIKQIKKEIEKLDKRDKELDERDKELDKELIILKKRNRILKKNLEETKKRYIEKIKQIQTK